MGIFTKHPYRIKYYLKHPIDFFSHYFRDIQCAYQRATKGYCYRDLWSIDVWFLNLFPKMLEEFNQIKQGHPSEITSDDWDLIIDDMIYYFKNANIETTDFINLYEKEYSKISEKKYKFMDFKKIKDSNFYEMIFPELSDEEKNICDNYYKEENLKFEYMKENLKKGFKLWNKYFYNLWD